MKRLLVPFVVILLAAAHGQQLAPSLFAEGASEVRRAADGSVVEGATSSLIRSVDAVAFELRTSDLEPGAVYTVWWVIFNNPGECSPDPMGDPGTPVCNEDDIFDAEGNVSPNALARISILWAAGNVARADGAAVFGAVLAEGDAAGEVLFGPGLESPFAAEVHLVVRTHGQPDLARLYEQLNTLEGDCAVCEDVQFAVHAPLAL